MYLAQTGIDPTQIIKALGAAGITGLMLAVIIIVAIIVIPVFILARLGARNERARIDSNASLFKTMADNMTALTNTMTTLAQTQAGMQTGAARRDQQMERMSDIQADQVKAIAELKQATDHQTKVLESGHEFQRKVVETITSGASDTTAVVGELGESLGTQLTDMQTKLADLISTIPGIVAEKTINQHAATKQSIVELSKEITRVFTPVLLENKDLKSKLELREDTIKAQNDRIIDMQAKLDNCPPPADIVHIVDKPADDAPPELKEVA